MSTPPLDNPFRESRLNTGTDFRPAWDVRDLNRSITDHLVKQIRAVKGRSQPDPGQMIQVLLAPPGYGKTHLFGRVGHELDQEVLFVFVPAFEDVSRPLEHIRWHVVESLFRERAGRPLALHEALARLCRPSFIEYVSQFPPSQAAHHQTLLQSLQSGIEAVLGIVQAVKLSAPFQKLAASLASRVQASTSVLRVLALGWSPLADTARRWLRGDSLPDEDLISLGLRPYDDPPTSLEVLKAIAALLQYQTPVVICCDQMEMVLKHPTGPEQITAPLIELLSQVPGQVLILSCLQTEWPQFLDKSFIAFRQRVAPPRRLADLNEAQAVELVSRRMQTWEGHQQQHAPTWPFDEASIIRYVRDHSQNPRVLIQRCGELFAEWAEGEQKAVLYVTRPKDVLDPAKVFLQFWNAELEKIAADPAVAWSEYQEERLYRGVREVLTLAREAGRDLGAVRVRNVAEGALQQRGKVPRRAFAVDLTAGGQDYRVVVPVTTLNSGHNFRYYFEDIELALKGPVEGCLLVHRQTEFQRGGQTRERFDALLDKRLRVFALEEHPATLQRMECLLRVLDRADGQELEIDNVTLSYKDCQDYVLKTAVLDSLDLLRDLSAWRKAAPVAKPATTVSSAAPAYASGASAAAAPARQASTGLAVEAATPPPKVPVVSPSTEAAPSFASAPLPGPSTPASPDGLKEKRQLLPPSRNRGRKRGWAS